MPIQYSRICAVCLLLLAFALLTPILSIHAQSLTSDYTPDLPSNIEWSGDADEWSDVAAAFNYARVQENSFLGTSLEPLVFPDSEIWQGMSHGEKTLWLINAERTARGLAPMQGLEENVTEVAQQYAEWLLANNLFAHDADGRTPWDRMNANPAIGNCHDFLTIGENLSFRATSSPDPIPFVVAQAIYAMLYSDAGSQWGHRQAILWTPYAENSGDPAREGFLGVGYAHGGFTIDGTYYQNADILVMDFFDPCAMWGDAPVTPQPAPTETPIPTETPMPGVTPPPTSEMIQQSRIVSGRVTEFAANTTAAQPNSISQSNLGLEGVTITITNAEGQRTQTDANGEFMLEGLSPGVYTLTPSKEGYSFSPVQIDVDLSAGDLAGLTFLGSSGPAGANLASLVYLPFIMPQ